MTRPLEYHAYLAGPDVFLPDAVAIGQAKKAFLKTLGITGHFPLDNELPKDAEPEPLAMAQAIAQANEDMMRRCCGEDRVGMMLVNMMPWHGPSMDVGTAYELGFMAQLARQFRVVILGYTPDAQPFEHRVSRECYHNNVQSDEHGILRALDGTMIEAFGQADNLMIINAIMQNGGTICSHFEQAAAYAKKLADSY